MKKLIAVLVFALLAGCAAVVKVEGEQVINNRLTVKLTDSWNKMSNSGGPFDLWTQEGTSLDQLRLWAGIKSGEALARVPNTPAGQTPPRVPTFTSGMAADQLVNLFEALYAVDGSLVKIVRAEPVVFAGAPGVRFELGVTSKANNVQYRVAGWAAEQRGELVAVTYSAPSLSFFNRLLPKAQTVVDSARLRS